MGSETKNLRTSVLEKKKKTLVISSDHNHKIKNC